MNKSSTHVCGTLGNVSGLRLLLCISNSYQTVNHMRTTAQSGGHRLGQKASVIEAAVFFSVGVHRHWNEDIGSVKEPAQMRLDHHPPR